MKVSSALRSVAFLLIQIFVLVEVFAFAVTSSSSVSAAVPVAKFSSQVAAHDEYTIQPSSSSDQPIQFGSHALDFIDFEEEKSERESRLDFSPLLFIGFLIDNFISEVSTTISLLSYSNFSFHSTAIFLLDCSFRI